jgi:DNA-binding response OmpR family regulator
MMSAPARREVCIIDDDEEFTNFVSRYLTSVGHTVRAHTAPDGFLADPDALGANIYLVDLMLPDIDGIDLVSMIRANGDAGIIVVSGRMGPDAFTTALAAGADMFVNKPVRADQIAQAIASLGWRLSAGQKAAESAWALDAKDGILISPAGERIRLGPLEQRILVALGGGGEEGYDRAELARISQIAPSTDDRNLDAAMFRLRRKIENITEKPSPIITRHGKGYSFSQELKLINLP